MRVHVRAPAARVPVPRRQRLLQAWLRAAGVERPTPDMKRSEDRRELKFLWWNVNDFAHYDPSPEDRDRWPIDFAAYVEKCRRLDAAPNAIFAEMGTPERWQRGLCVGTLVRLIGGH